MQKTIITILSIIFLLPVFGADTGNVPEVCFENGYVSFIRGEYGTALEEFSRFIDLEQKAANPRLQKIAMMHSYRGACFEKLRLTSRAIHEYQAALGIQSGLKDSVEVSSTLMKLGRLYFMEKKPDQAVLFIRRAAHYFEKMQWPAMLQNTLFLLGEIEFDRRDYPAAREYFTRSLIVNNKKGFRSEHTYLEGETWFYLARISSEENLYASADYQLQKAENEFRMVMNDLPQFYDQWINLHLYRARLTFNNDPDMAWKNLSEAVSFAESRSLYARRPDILLVEAEFHIQNKAFRKAEILLDRIKKSLDEPGNYLGLAHYPGFLKTSARLYMNWYEAQADPALLRKGLQISETFHRQNNPSAKIYALLRDRGYSGKNDKALRDMTIRFASKLFELTRDRAYFETAVFYAESFSAALYAEESQLAKEAAQLSDDGKSRVTEAMLRLKINNLIAETGEKGMQDEQEKTLVNLVNQLESFRLSQDFTKPQGPVFIRKDLIEQLQQKLDEEESYLKIYETEEELLQFLITKKNVSFTQTLKNKEFNGARDVYAAFVTNPGTRSNLDDITGFVTASCLLYQKLIAPLEKDFGEGDLVIEWPDAENRIVFEPLLTAPVRNISLDMKKLPFLLWEKSIRYAGSIGWYIKDFPEYTSCITLSYAGFAPFAEKSYGRRIKLASSGGEVKKLARIFGGKPFVAQKATKARLLQLAGKSKILHLATHARENPDHPQLTELSFQGRNKQTEKLHYFEIGQEEWSNQLVILGACGTASGEYIPGYGTASLANIFQSAGVQSIIGANWPAEDDVSLKIIGKFAGNLKQGKGAAASLWQSKKKFLQQADDRWSHPYYWAVYTYQGPEQFIDFGVDKKGNYWIIWFAGAGLLLVIGGMLLRILNLKS